MVGFVLIMLLVAIIFLVFLGIYLRGASKTHETESKEVASFLEAVSKLTTECGFSSEYLYDVSKLIFECSKNPEATCHNNKKICNVLKETLNNAINSTWNFNENSPTKAYFMQILKETSADKIDVISPIGYIPPRSQYEIRAAEKPFPNGIIMKLEIYY